MAFQGQPPPLTPVLLAGLAARPVPPAVIQPLLDLAMAAVARRHGEVFARLDGLGEGVTFPRPESPARSAGPVLAWSRHLFAESRATWTRP